MTDQGNKFLSDILQAIESIESFIVDTKDFNDFLSDRKTQSAVERQLGVIGEAVNKFEKLFPDLQLSNAIKIVGLRNRIIHTDDSVDPSIIWAIIKIHLGPLKEEVYSKM
jgi:uncharacterized protein with HEPN domain